MKKCEYCAKEITYHQMYCDESCQRKANDFYDMRENRTKLFSVINGICVLAVGIGIFAYSFIAALGAYLVSFSLLILGIMYFFCPFPPDVMIQKYKLEKSIKITKIISLFILLLGFAALIFAIFTT